MRKTADKVPTAWFGAILTGLFLAATAMFGSLNTAAVPDPPVAELGQEIVTDAFAITVHAVSTEVTGATR